MVGIVVVSHSRALARETARLVREVNIEQNISVAYAGGAEGGFNRFGSDAFDILTAIRAVKSNSGIAVLVDIGSTRLSAELAIELLDEAEAEQVRLLSAPLVEGALVAAVQSAAGASLEEVSAEAEHSCREAPQTQDPVSTSTVEESNSSSWDEERSDALSGQVMHQIYRVLNRHGLHVRAAAKLIETVRSSGSTVLINNLTNARGPVIANSLSRLSTIDVLQGHQILISADGPDAAAVIHEIGRLINTRFGEDDEEAPVWARKRPNGLLPLSPGIGIGSPLMIPPISLDLPVETVKVTKRELEHLRAAITKVKQAVQMRIDHSLSSPICAEREIFEGHLMLLSDPEFVGRAEEFISRNRWSAPYAWSVAAREVISHYESAEEEYLQVGATDAKDVAGQVLATLGIPGIPIVSLLAVSDRALRLSDTVVVSTELTASETFDAAYKDVAAIITAAETPVSHAAIVARAMGIPAVGGYRGDLSGAQMIVVDGFEGAVYVDPPAHVLRAYMQRRQAYAGGSEDTM